MDDATSYLDFDDQQAALARQKTLADRLRQKADSTPMAEGQMVSGRYVGINPLQAMIPAMYSYQAAAAEGDYGKASKGFNKAINEDVIQQLRAFPQGTPEKLPEGFGVGPEGTYAPGTPAQPPTQEQILNASGKMFSNPKLSQFGLDLAKEELVNRPKAEALAKATAAQHRADREATLKAAVIKAGANGNFELQTDSNGHPIGSFDKKSSVFYKPDGSWINYTTGQTGEGGAALASQGTGQPAPTPTTASSSSPTTPNALPLATGNMVKVPGLVEPVPANKIPGYVELGKTASPDAKKAQQEILAGYGNATIALKNLEQMTKMVNEGGIEEHGMNEWLSDVNQFVGPTWLTSGKSSPSVVKLKQFGVLAAELTSMADRKMYGPQFSNQDVIEIKNSVGNLAAAKSNEERQALLKTLHDKFEARLGITKPDPGDWQGVQGPAPTQQTKATSPSSLPQPKTPEERAALQKGTVYLDPNGVERVKK